LCTGVGLRRGAGWEADTGIFNSRGAGAGAGAISSRSLGSGESLASVTPASLSAVVGTFCVLVVCGIDHCQQAVPLLVARGGSN
jgi:hypothetical protein